MQRKKILWYYILVGSILSGYVGYLFNGSYEKGITLQEFQNNVHFVISKPFQNYYNETTMKAIVLAVGIYMIALFMNITNTKKYMLGEEYGTAEFADVKVALNRFKEKKSNYNRILSQNVQMSLNTRKTRLNNNILVIGGAGAGKTLFLVKPNLMQLNTSYIITDP